MAAVPIGAVGVEAGMRTVREVLANDAKQRKATFMALLQVCRVHVCIDMHAAFFCD